MNRVEIIGRLTRDPELRFTPNGKPVTTMFVAVNKPYGDKQANFFKVQVWLKPAENAAKYLSKGRQVGIAGHLEQAKRMARDQQGKLVEVKDNYGNNVWDTWITADSVYYLGDNPNPSSNGSNQNAHQYDAQEDYGGYDPGYDDYDPGYDTQQQGYGNNPQQGHNDQQQGYGQAQPQNQGGRMSNQQNRSGGNQQQQATQQQRQPQNNGRQNGSNNAGQQNNQRGSRNQNNNVVNYNREHDQRYGDMEALPFNDDDLPF